MVWQRPRRSRGHEGIEAVMRGVLEQLDMRFAASSLDALCVNDDFDYLIDDFYPPELMLVEGEDGSGWQEAASAVMRFALRTPPCPVLIFSLVETRVQIGERLLAKEAEVDPDDLRGAWCDRAQMTRVVVAAERLAKAPITIDDSVGLCAGAANR